MKKLCAVLLFCVSSHLFVSAQALFDTYFEEASLRIDFILTGNKQIQSAHLMELKKELYWGGSKKNLVDAFNYGEYVLCLFDSQTKDTIFTRGFCTLFEEWRTTEEAENTNKAFYQTVTCPFPISSVDLEISARQKNGTFKLLYRTVVSPKAYSICNETPISAITTKILNNGEAHNHVDIAFIAEGYTENEQDKFIADVKRLTDYLFSCPPYDELKQAFNIWAIGAISEESGTDNPRANQWVNTALNASFNTFDTDRYLESMDVKSIRDYAANAPYDQIFVLVNSDKYGGGGIYNHFSIGTADHLLSEKVFIHEFGHGFAGLGDEYYSSSVSYLDFFNLKVEPWQPNLTTLVNFEEKWKNMLDDDTPIPTPAADERKIGVYEGGGYLEKGIYRPAINCRMKSNEANGFCPVCQQAIRDMIFFLTN